MNSTHSYNFIAVCDILLFNRKKSSRWFPRRWPFVIALVVNFFCSSLLNSGNARWIIRPLLIYTRTFALVKSTWFHDNLSELSEKFQKLRLTSGYDAGVWTQFNSQPTLSAWGNSGSSLIFRKLLDYQLAATVKARTVTQAYTRIAKLSFSTFALHFFF